MFLESHTALEPMKMFSHSNGLDANMESASAVDKKSVDCCNDVSKQAEDLNDQSKNLLDLFHWSEQAGLQQAISGLEPTTAQPE